jgi:hypothetical protein
MFSMWLKVSGAIMTKEKCERPSPQEARRGASGKVARSQKWLRIPAEDSACSISRMESRALIEPEFTHILSTFPLVPETTKAAALAAFRAGM